MRQATIPERAAQHLPARTHSLEKMNLFAPEGKGQRYLPDRIRHVRSARIRMKSPGNVVPKSLRQTGMRGTRNGTWEEACTGTDRFRPRQICPSSR